MKIQILCSTMNGIKPLLYSNNIDYGDIVVVNQYSDSSDKVPTYYNYNEIGLSKSRNRAVENSDADICIITDNDVVLDKNIIRIVEDQFIQNPDADIITFMAETPEGLPFKSSYKDNVFKHNIFSVGKVSSIEIAFRRKSLLSKAIKFDEEFGLGTRNCTGEEFILLTDAIKKGLKVIFCPNVIAYHPKESSGSSFDKIDLIYAKGAMFRRVFGFLGIIVCVLFSFKKYKLSNFGYLSFLLKMLKGFFR